MNDNIERYLTNLTRQEHKKIKALVEGDKRLSLFVHNTNFCHSNVAGFNAKPYISLIGVASETERFCYGKNGAEPFHFGNDATEEDFIRVIIDTKDKHEKNILFHHKNKSYVYSTSDECTNRLFVMYTETKSYAHYCLYDGFLAEKFSEIYVRDDKAKESLRVFAFSMIRRLYPEVSVGGVEQWR
ncbi:hypothetical protein OM416_27720 [Paenibacillus sp. LS1]|uniref:hypothetical protein n=1 Tax=Paenibacillus sp. LS1 TaxID=2992120 RepID=UPI002232A36B|nr:hypothetical protein [Paenibacillus sp. LS1]MCW3795401.1 hypothetical protein [Paenibacillus sp. LS1]